MNNEEPTFDADGYPTDATLETIRTWDVSTASDAIAAMDYVGRAWHWRDWGWEKETGWRPDSGPTISASRSETRYLIHTGGWSGNESLISALQDNMMLQMLGWWSSRRGGHYEYRFPEDDSAVYGLPRETSVGS